MFSARCRLLDSISGARGISGKGSAQRLRDDLRLSRIARMWLGEVQIEAGLVTSCRAVALHRELVDFRPRFFIPTTVIGIAILRASSRFCRG